MRFKIHCYFPSEIEALFAHSALRALFFPMFYQYFYYSEHIFPR
jgi:hypothetical protein